MIRQCAWCCRVLGQIAPLENVAVTHGLCPECYAKLVETVPAGSQRVVLQDAQALSNLAIEVNQ